MVNLIYLIKRTAGSRSIFQDSDSEKRREYIHHIVLRDLILDQKYSYHCSSEAYDWSPLFWFTAIWNNSNFIVCIAIYDDMDKDNVQSMVHLQEETQSSQFDRSLHVRDTTYDINDDNACFGDEYINSIQSIAASMTCLENHKNAYKPSSDDTYDSDANHSYSFNVGSVHIISFSTESYCYLDYGLKAAPRGDLKQIINQYKWIEEDLKKTNLPENLAKQPWTITMTHKIIYFCKFGFHVYNGTRGVYIDPNAPVHIVIESVGCTERHDPFGVSEPWIAFQNNDYVYTRMNVYNSTRPQQARQPDTTDEQAGISKAHGDNKEALQPTILAVAKNSYSNPMSSSNSTSFGLSSNGTSFELSSSSSSSQSYDIVIDKTPSVEANSITISPELKLDLLKTILEYPSICFIISQLTKSISKLKHNYQFLKSLLNELVTMGILICLNNGIRSGNNLTSLYVKVLPEALEVDKVEQFYSKNLWKLGMSWALYRRSCRNLILSSSSAVLSKKAKDILNCSSYKSIVRVQNMSSTSGRSSRVINKKKEEKVKMSCTNTILNYFHRTINNIHVLPRKNDETMTKEDDPHDRQINNNSNNQTLKSKITSPLSSAAASSSSPVAPPITSLSGTISVSTEKISNHNGSGIRWQCIQNEEAKRIILQEYHEYLYDQELVMLNHKTCEYLIKHLTVDRSLSSSCEIVNLFDNFGEIIFDTAVTVPYGKTFARSQPDIYVSRGTFEAVIDTMMLDILFKSFFLRSTIRQRNQFIERFLDLKSKDDMSKIVLVRIESMANLDDQ
ncbi:unnamed protein product [Rotaria sp. Silwood1]|nr:unnamed protein product [Rotaria sp. Silwood1]CAF1445460.1 unnamed protein product [Rotaria sp. Silwood1]CAF3608794.1 unnamed protein product [Rotaria sp. Silwood1]CAF3635783.1 unnamed protein product [Rotaria sp. Silwood1]CAF4711047.1 unnamed protein product [Rotaria sp. Silwood1]